MAYQRVTPIEKKMITAGALLFLTTSLLSGCTDTSTNTNTGDFAQIHDASDNIIKTQLLNDGYDYHDIEAMIFSVRNVEILEENRWKVSGEFTIAGTTHSYTTELSLINGQYNGIATIS